MHIFLPFTDALHNDRGKISNILLCLPKKYQNREKEVLNKKKMELENIIIIS